METDIQTLEREANSFLYEQKYAEAFRLFEKVATLYKRERNHKQAALCYTSAASCWNMQCGEKRFYRAAISYENAAREAEIARDLEYASMLHKHAAINYGRDGEFNSLSNCVYNSKECYRKFLTYRLIRPNKIHALVETKEKRGIKGALRRFFLWLLLTLSFLIWGHGEKPFRVFVSGIIVVSLATIFYSLTHLLKDGVIFRPSFFDAFYFSVITFTTVGYGDFTPVGFSRLIALIESFCGIFLIPIFIISLSRKYLRI